MKGQNKKIVYGAILLAVVGLIGWHLSTRTARTPTPTETPSGLVATSTTIDVSGIKLEGEGTGVVSIERVPGGTSSGVPQPIPNLDVPAITKADLPQNIKEILSANIKRYSDLLKKDPSVYDNWINLGLQLKIANEFERTRDAWEYASKLAPSSIVSFINLGDLYGYYLKRPDLAEARFRTALKNDPAQLGIYLRLADFYQDVVKDESKVSAIIDQGLVKFPDNPELLKYKK
jgi:hypothetical protein